MHCPNCGQEMLEGAKFCENCGAPVVRQQAGPICDNCGSSNQPEAEFCTECGARLRGDVMPMQSFCPECGAAVKEGAAFCNECGAGLNATTDLATFVCPECGEPLPPEAVFCGNCGMSLRQAEYQQQAQPQDWEYAQQQQEQPQDQEYPRQEEQYQPQLQNWEPIQSQQAGQPQPQKSNRNKMLMAAAAAVILLVVGITGFWKPGFLLDLFRSTAKLENGTLALNDISLDFKQTNLSNGAATMTTVKDKEEEINNGLIGDLYVMKIDKSCQGKVTVAIPVPKDFKPTTGNGLYIKLGVGRDYPLTDGTTARFYEYFDATVKDGKAVAVIDPSVSGQSRHKSKTPIKPTEETPDVGEFTEYVGFFYKEGLILYGEGYQNAKGHFRVWYPYVPKLSQNVYMGGDEAQRLLSDLEEAYNYYKTNGYPDHVDKFTPIDVYISNCKNEGGWNTLTGNMELREKSMFGADRNLRYEGDQRTTIRATIYHEMFHAVQQSIHNIVVGKSFKTAWIDEATSTHFEKVIVRDPLTENGKQYFWLLWGGLIPEKKNAEEGYARGVMIDYMSSKLGGDAWIRECHELWDGSDWIMQYFFKKIADTEANFAANFYMEVIRKLGGEKDPAWYHSSSQSPNATMGEDHYLSAIKLQLDDKTKEKIEKNGEDASPIVFTSPSFELGPYGGHVVGVVTKTLINKSKVVNLTEDFPDKCQLKLEAEGGCRIQILEFTNANNKIIKGNIIKDFKGQINKGYKYIVLVTSTQNKKQTVALKATLEKEELKEGIYHGKTTITQGKKTATRNNVLGFRLSKGKDGKWGLNVCQANGDYMATAANVPLTYDAKQKIWKGHRKFKEDVSKNPNQPKIETVTLDCIMKVNLEGKEPVLIINYNADGNTWKWGYPTREKYDIKFEGKWSSELKGKNLSAGKEGKITILE